MPPSAPSSFPDRPAHLGNKKESLLRPYLTLPHNYSHLYHLPQDMERARGCFRHLKTLFQELEEIRPFELLRGQGDRVNYLMSKQAKVDGAERRWACRSTADCSLGVESLSE